MDLYVAEPSSEIKANRCTQELSERVQQTVRTVDAAFTSSPTSEKVNERPATKC